MQEAFPGAKVIDKIEAGFNELTRDANEASMSARNSWIIFIALIAYFLVSLASISHRDLLLDQPVNLPILGVEISLKAFFLFGPAALLLMHFNLLLQHAMLARKVRDLHDRVTRFEGTGLFRMHRVRIQLHSYFYSQLIAGPLRSGFFALFLRLMTWLSLVVLPVITLIGFQVTFLPYHDLTVTWAHRTYLIVDLTILTVLGVFMRYPDKGFVSGFGASIGERPLSFLMALLTGMAVLFLSISVATIPEERMDRVMTAMWPVAVPQAEGDARRPRYAFGLTVTLFEGRVDYLGGRVSSVFARNLVVPDTDLVRDPDVVSKEATLSLRRRDLRYGVFDRTDLHQADMAGVIATGASFREANLSSVRTEHAEMAYADLTGATVAGSDFLGANLRGVSFSAGNLRGTSFRGANLAGAVLRGANVGTTRWENARVAGADFTGAINLFPADFTAEQKAEAKMPQ